MTAGRILLLAMFSIALLGLNSTNAFAEGCEDGVDCFCDRVTDPQDPFYDPDVIFCEDFEALSLRSYTPSTDGGNRDKGSSGWFDVYPGQHVGCFDKSLGSHNVVGPEDYKCVNIFEKSSCGSSSEFACVPDGNYAMGSRYKAGQHNGIYGTATWDEPTRVFGYTSLWKYDANYVQNGVQPRKTNEFISQGGRGKHCILGCNTNNGDRYASWVDPAVIPENHKAGMPGSLSFGIPYSASNEGAAGGKINVGTLQSFTTTYHIVPDLSVWPTVDKLGVPPEGWTCQSIHVDGWGTSDAHIRAWWNGTLVVDIEGVDMTGLRDGPVPLEGFVWNNYTNKGYTGSQDSWRYEDNVVVTKGPEPVSCDALGATGGPVTPPPPPNQVPPQPPILLPPS